MGENMNETINELVAEYASSCNIEVQRNAKREPSTSSHVPALTGLRGMAALLVAYSHYSGSGGTLGQLGVQIFFVLSAYLMSVLYLNKPEKTPAEFIRNRLIRVVPLMALVAIVAKACSYFPSLKFYDIFGAEEPLWKYLSLKSGATIEWTIAMEVAFYLLFATVLTLPKTPRAWCLFLCTTGGILTFIFAPSQKFETFTGIHWGIITEKAYVYKWFTLGILAWYMEETFVENKWLHPQTLREIFGKIVLEGIFSAVFASCFLVRCIYWDNFAAGVYNNWDSIVDAVGMIILLLGSKHLWPLRSLLSSPLMHHIGEISYSFYLTHLFVFVFMNRRGLRDAGNPLLVLSFLAVCALLSTITFYCIEKPANSALRKAWKHSRNNTVKQQEHILPLYRRRASE